MIGQFTAVRNRPDNGLLCLAEEGPVSDGDDVHLFIPGPAAAHPDVLAAAAAPIRPHYGAEFVAEFNRCRRQMKRVFRTSNDLYLVAGPGTAALEAAITSVLVPGSPVLVPTNGIFGDRLAQICRAHGADVRVMEFPLGEPIDATAVVRCFAEEPRPRAVVWVHHETSTGVLNPVEPIATAGREAGVISIIDAISSLGGTELPIDDWGVDLCASVSNKGLAAQPGLAPISISPQAWEAIEASGPPRAWLFDLRTYRRLEDKWGHWHPFPTTMPTGLMSALNVSLGLILEEGLSVRIRRTREAAERVRQGLRDLGFSMLCADSYASPITTAVLAREDIPVAEMIETLRHRYGIYISGGIDELAGKIFRIGHMGRSIEPQETDRLLRAFDDVVCDTATRA